MPQGAAGLGPDDNFPTHGILPGPTNGRPPHMYTPFFYDQVEDILDLGWGDETLAPQSSTQFTRGTSAWRDWWSRMYRNLGDERGAVSWSNQRGMPMIPTSRPALPPGILEQQLAGNFGFSGNYPATGTAALPESARTRAFYNQLNPLYDSVQGVPRTLTERLGRVAPTLMGGDERGAVSLAPQRPPSLGGAAMADNMLANLGIDPAQAVAGTAGTPQTAGSALPPVGSGAAEGGAQAAARGRTGWGVANRLGGGTPRSGLAAGVQGLGGLALSALSPTITEATGGDDSLTGQFAGGTAAGAGLGLGFLGPKGALIGGLVGGIGNVVTNGGLGRLLGAGDGDSGPTDPDEALDEILAVSGVSPETVELARNTYAIRTAIDESDEAKTTALNDIGQMVLEDLVAQETTGQQQDLALAMQAQAQQYLQPYNDQFMQTAAVQNQLTNQLLGDLPPEYRGVAQLSSAQNMNRAAMTSAAYANQVAAMPQVAALEQASGLQAQLQQQLNSQMLGDLTQQTGGAGGTDILAQLGIGV